MGFAVTVLDMQGPACRHRVLFFTTRNCIKFSAEAKTLYNFTVNDSYKKQTIETRTYSSQALWHISPHQTIIKEQAIDWKQGDLVIEACYSLISTGTEGVVARGEVPESLFETMRVPYMGGTFTFPCKYGYSLVGIVREGPKDWIDRPIHLLHPHQSHCVAKPEHCTLLPEQLDLHKATLISNLETALTAVWDSHLAAGDRVLVVGFGLIGALTALLAGLHPGVEVFVAERHPGRRQKAQALGLQLWQEELPPFDLAFNASSSAFGLQLAIEEVGLESRVVELSWYGERTIELQLGADFHRERKQIISSQVSTIPGSHTQRWDYKRRKEAVVRLLQLPVWDALLEEPFPLIAMPSVFEQIRRGTYAGMSCVVRYD